MLSLLAPFIWTIDNCSQTDDLSNFLSSLPSLHIDLSMLFPQTAHLSLFSLRLKPLQDLQLSFNSLG